MAGEETVVNFAEFKGRKDAPDPENLCQDPFGRQMQRYLLEYGYSGGEWSCEVWAYSMEDAQERVAAMKDTLTLKGQLMSTQPA